MQILITGGHSGLGMLLTRRLVEEGHSVSLIVRFMDRLADLGDITASLERIYVGDLADAKDRARLCKEINAASERLDVLINNAGVLLPDIQLSPQGNEMHYEVNALAPIDLMLRLRPLLIKSELPRVVNVVSDDMSAKSLDVSTLLNPTKMRKLFGSYMVSKTALTHAGAFLAKKHGWSSINVVSVTPGPNKTKMTAGDGMPFWLRPFRSLFFARPDVGADRIYDVVFSRYPTGSFIKKGKVQPLGFDMQEKTFEEVFGSLAT
ncbi:SDR family oxidoreductase [uncultured Tateyamaria sp.]|uniref:SDR family NAD(P)-dependent oxidoreductase n=1 Tax=uncultured Tateyamaria sp. TaxID=455651 RepID=UPI0026215D3B|nr:SDR family oxidoreductase [uncultured Tateyamaria sp.]